MPVFVDVHSVVLSANVPGVIESPRVMKLAFSKNLLKNVAFPISLKNDI